MRRVLFAAFTLVILLTLPSRLVFGLGDSEEDLDTCKKQLRDSDDQVRAKAVRALAKMRSRARAATNDLIHVLDKDKVPEVRMLAAHALRAIYFRGDIEADTNAIQALIRALKTDNDTLVRWVACESFGAIGPSAKDAAPALLALLKEKSDTHLQELARSSLYLIAGPQCKQIVPELLLMYKDGISDPQIEATVIEMLGKIGANEDVVLPLLIELVKNRNTKRPRSRGAAARGLGAMGSKAKTAVPLLIETLEQSMFLEQRNQRNISCDILYAFRIMGSPAHVAIPVIEKVANDFRVDDYIQGEARFTLIRMKKMGQ